LHSFSIISIVVLFFSVAGYSFELSKLGKIEIMNKKEKESEQKGVIDECEESLSLNDFNDVGEASNAIDEDDEDCISLIEMGQLLLL